jgi:transcriptional regulator with XRE-family HTH domain
MAARNDIQKTQTDPDREYLANRLKEAREYLGLSQEYVAQQTQMPRPAISEIEAGRRRVESIELQRLAALYGRPLSYFLPSEEPLPSEVRGQIEIEAKLRNTTKNLPIDDIQEILRFAEYLRHKKLAADASGSAERKQTA